MGKEDSLKKLDELFKNANPSWLFIKDTVKKFIDEYFNNPNQESYIVNVSNDEQNLYFGNPISSISLLKIVLQESGIKCKEKIVFNYSDSFITIETELE